MKVPARDDIAHLTNGLSSAVEIAAVLARAYDLGVAALLSCDRSAMRQSSYVAEAPLCLGSCCGVCVRGP